MFQVNAWYMYVFTSEWRESQKPPRQYLFTHSIHYLFAICDCYAYSCYSTRTDDYPAHIVVYGYVLSFKRAPILLCHATYYLYIT